TRLELESIPLWSEDDPEVRPCSDFFVNQRIDLMVREAETFRNDYRNSHYRDYFLSLRKPLPWYHGRAISTDHDLAADLHTIETINYNGVVLLLCIGSCLTISARTIVRQNRATR
ncbi:MAG TPA: hypothetical protein VFY13_03295, partial [Luteolibacter sp.]|nr:hypothetical protein [Luteolibacter sp.]